MKTVYIDRSFRPVVVQSVNPGDRYADPARGECRRLTAKRLCLAAERAGKESDALQGLLAAIRGAAESGKYDGRSIEDWYGLVGMECGEAQQIHHRRVCPVCRRVHWAIDDYEGGDLCMDCWMEEMKIC